MNKKSSAFDDDENFDEISSNNKLKLNQSKSRFSKPNEDNLSKKLEDKVGEIQNRDQKLIKDALEFSTRYMSLIKNKTLKSNKGPIEQDLETEIVKGLIQIAMDLNNDDSKPEGIGSAGVLTLLLRSVLAQRDIINNLEYELVQLKRRIKPSSENKD
jgi:hypothetical protein